MLTRLVVAGGAAFLVGCSFGPPPSPPKPTWFGGLPASGSLSDAHRGGFTDCYGSDAVKVRCRRHGVTFFGAGPYEAAVDLLGSDGTGGFDQVTLWHDRDQYAVYKITDVLDAAGWRNCSTGTDMRGDQIIYTKAGERVRVSMDLSYWGKRRLRVIPLWNKAEQGCTPQPQRGRSSASQQ